MDLEELTSLLSVMTVEEVSREEFEEKAKISQILMPQLEDYQKLMLYGLFKQSTAGNAPGSAPTEDRMSAEYFKWEAWKSFNNIGGKDSMRLYVYFVGQFQEAAEITKGGKENKDFGSVGSSVSTLFVDYTKDSAEWASKQPIFNAVLENDLEKLKALLAEGVNVNEINEDGMAVLHFAVDKGKADLVDVLLENGANVNILDGSRQTPLMYALICDYEEIAKQLLRRTDIDVSIVNGDGETALDLADGNSTLESLIQSVTPQTSN